VPYFICETKNSAIFSYAVSGKAVDFKSACGVFFLKFSSWLFAVCLARTFSRPLDFGHLVYKSGAFLHASGKKMPKKL